MEHFAALISALESSNKTNDKLQAIASYLSTAPDADKLWLIALFSGKKPRRPVKTSLIRQWALELAGIPEWLFLESYSNVGDLGETVSLILPKPVSHIKKKLSEWMQEVVELYEKTEKEKRDYVLESWSGLDYTERFIFNKLIGGSFRIGVSYKLLVNAIAKYENLDSNAVMHRVMGQWSPSDTTYRELIAGDHINTDQSKPYPFCLAYALDKEPAELGDALDWQVEHKWDGIRGQLIKRSDEVFIWSRGEELITDQFPELLQSVRAIPYDFVMDGEILVWKEGAVMSFNQLQKRLNRKSVSRKMMEETPVVCMVYDLPEWEGKDIRESPLRERRYLLEQCLVRSSSLCIKLSPVLTFNDWSQLTPIREQARDVNAEGVMLKAKDSVYHAGRKRGDWWKWKISPMSLDAVLIYAQKGSGRRSNFYTDYTFAVKKGDELVTIAKAYSGLTDKEIIEVDRFIKQNALEKFGPVRTVKPELVFEIGFEGIGFSNRHKSGVALRFPRILRWRKDKIASEVDDIEEVKKLIRE